MDTKKSYESVVLPNYEASKADPGSFQKIWNAIQSVSTLSEYVALERLEYGDVKRKDVDAVTDSVLRMYPDLYLLKDPATTLRHVRRHDGQEVTSSSTGIEPDNPATWVLEDGPSKHNLSDVLDRAMAVFPTVLETK
jgi:hypothetical protein